VEDTASGLASGRAAGCTTLGVGTDLDADIVVPDLSHVRFELAGDRVTLHVQIPTQASASTTNS
jgi:sugar-phosphatase